MRVESATDMSKPQKVRPAQGLPEDLFGEAFCHACTKVVTVYRDKDKKVWVCPHCHNNITAFEDKPPAPPTSSEGPDRDEEYPDPAD